MILLDGDRQDAAVRIKPKRLAPGGTIGLICPASPPKDPATVDRCVEAVERLGFVPTLGRFARHRNGFLAGSDRERAADITAMFRHRRVDAIWCIRGGYGCARLLDRLDFDIIRSHPKILIGYSDITALHLALWQEARLVSFHGPLIAGECVPKPTRLTLSSLRQVLCPMLPKGGEQVLPTTVISRRPLVLRSGRAEGPLIGGNLSLVTSLIGTRYLPSLRGAILFLEDVNEAPYRVDRCLTQLRMAGALEGLAGIALGQFTHCQNSPPAAGRARDLGQQPKVEDVLRERLRPLKVPILGNLPFGHVKNNVTLPVGIRARLDTRTGTLELLENAVKAG